jgi:hypothetical protein
MSKQTQETNCRSLPGSSVDRKYCLGDLTENCAWKGKDPTNPQQDAFNQKCEPCAIFNLANDKCGNFNQAQCAKNKTCDDSCAFWITHDNCNGGKWKMIATKQMGSSKGPKGIEDLFSRSGDATAKDVDKAFQALWATAQYDKAKPTKPFDCSSYTIRPFHDNGMMINAYGYRSQHILHAHVGEQMHDLKSCIAYILKEAEKNEKYETFKAQMWSQPHSCEFSTRSGSTTVRCTPLRAAEGIRVPMWRVAAFSRQFPWLSTALLASRRACFWAARRCPDCAPP